MEWIYKKIWELKSKALTLENKARIQKLQQLLDNPTQKETASTSNDSEKRDKNNSAKNSKDSSIDSSNTKDRDISKEIDTFLFNRYNR